MLKQVVTISGGNGSAITLRALAPYAGKSIELNALIPTSDSGGSSGRLRQEFGVIPPGDILRAVLALSKYDFETLRSIFYKKRFENLGAVLDGHNLGNMILTLMRGYAGDFISAVRALEQAVSAVGQVYPITEQPTELCVRLRSGKVIKGEAQIDRPDYDRADTIVEAWLESVVEASANALALLKAADAIVFGPGSLYCSVIPILLTGGVKEVIVASRARLIYVLGSGYELHGETGAQRAEEFVAQLERYLSRSLDKIVYNNHVLTAQEQAAYRARNWAQVVLDSGRLQESRLIAADLEHEQGGVDPEKLSPLLFKLLG